MLQLGWVLLIWSQTRLLCSARYFFFYYYFQLFRAQTGWKTSRFCSKPASPVTALRMCQPPHIRAVEIFARVNRALRGAFANTSIFCRRKTPHTDCGRHRKRWIGAACLCSEEVPKCMCVSGRVSFFKGQLSLCDFFLCYVGLAEGEKIALFWCSLNIDEWNQNYPQVQLAFGYCWLLQGYSDETEVLFLSQELWDRIHTATAFWSIYSTLPSKSGPKYDSGLLKAARDPRACFIGFPWTGGYSVSSSCCTCVVTTTNRQRESHNHGMAWVERDLKDHLYPCQRLVGSEKHLVLSF